VRHSFAALAIATVAFAPLAAPAQSYPDNDTPMQTPAEAARSRAEREAAKTQWAALPPSEKIAVKKAARDKRWSDLSALEMISDNDTEMLTPDQAAQLKSERQAAQAQWASMSPDARAAMRKAVRQKRLSDMTELEKVAGSGS